MKCPSCKDDTNLLMTERVGIEVDYCPNCRGVWLDRGELDKIIGKSQLEESNSRVLPREKIQDVIYRDSERQQDYKYKKKKSFLQELFD